MYYYVLKVYFYDGSWGYYVSDWYNNLKVSQNVSEAENFGSDDFLGRVRGDSVMRDHGNVVSRCEVVRIEK